jgi:lipoprotein-releasing system ATP-binding protein
MTPKNFFYTLRHLRLCGEKKEALTLLEVTNLSKDYPTPQGALSILSNVSFKLSRGDAASIMGPSGSGKSTLLYIVGALEPPTSGTVELDGENPFQLEAKSLAAFRNRNTGFVFQDHCLLPQLTVLENVLTPTLVAGADGDYTARARKLLEQVGLSERLSHRPAELSGGEKQRVALARALIMKPLLLLCDEPTGNLDHKSAETVASLLLELHGQQQTILIVITHSAELAARFPTRFEMAEQNLRPVTPSLAG